MMNNLPSVKQFTAFPEHSQNKFKSDLNLKKHPANLAKYSQVNVTKSILLYQKVNQKANQFIPLDRARPGDRWIEEIQITKQVFLNHLGKLAPRLNLRVNGATYNLQQAGKSDGKHLGLDAFFCAHDVFQHCWSAGLGFINTPTTIGGEEATGGVQRYGQHGTAHASPLSDIPKDAIQQLGRLHEQAASSQQITKSAYTKDGDTYTMLDLWAAQDMAEALGEETIPDKSVLTIKIGRPSSDRYFVVDPTYQLPVSEPNQFTEYHSANKILTDYRALKQGEKTLQQLLQAGVKPDQTVARSDRVEITYRLKVPNYPNYHQLIIASQAVNLVDNAPKFQEVLYECQHKGKTEIFTPREFDLIRRKIPCQETVFNATKSLVVYASENEFNTAHVFLKEIQSDKIIKLAKTRFRYEFYTPLIDRPTGLPYEQSQVLEIDLTLPSAEDPEKINLQELKAAIEHFVKVFKRIENRREALLAGKMSSWHRVGDGGDEDPRRTAYAKEYESFTKSDNPFDHFMFHTLGLNFPQPEQVHLTRKLLPPHSEAAEKKP